MQVTGLYRFVRHPRYAGMFAAVVGAGILAGTRAIAILVALWIPLMLVVIGLEERELKARFGSAYVEYSRAVPRFLPVRFRARAK
jgi:methanethiol S-methyltransferase